MFSVYFFVIKMVRPFTFQKVSCSCCHLALLLDKDLEVLVGDGHGEEDSGAGADGAHEVGDD